MVKPLIVGDDNFERVILKAQLPTLVDFWAPSCGPCQALSPIMDELADAYCNKIAFAKVNVDESPKTTNMYGIRSIPTLLLFRDGKPLRQVVGLKGRREIRQLLDETAP